MMKRRFFSPNNDYLNLKLKIALSGAKNQMIATFVDVAGLEIDGSCCFSLPYRDAIVFDGVESLGLPVADSGVYERGDCQELFTFGGKLVCEKVGVFDPSLTPIPTIDAGRDLTITEEIPIGSPSQTLNESATESPTETPTESPTATLTSSSSSCFSPSDPFHRLLVFNVSPIFEIIQSFSRSESFAPSLA
jgi:hypothetical protein